MTRVLDLGDQHRFHWIYNTVAQVVVETVGGVKKWAFSPYGTTITTLDKKPNPISSKEPLEISLNQLYIYLDWAGWLATTAE